MPAYLRSLQSTPAYLTDCLLQVAPIVEDVRSRGDEAVREYTAKFDRVQLDAVCVPIEVRSRVPA